MDRDRWASMTAGEARRLQILENTILIVLSPFSFRNLGSPSPTSDNINLHYKQLIRPVLYFVFIDMTYRCICTSVDFM